MNIQACENVLQTLTLNKYITSRCAECVQELHWHQL